MATDKQITTKQLFAREDVQEKFKEMLGNRAPQFITSVLQIASSNDLLAKADPMTIYNAAATAATLDLPLNNALGFAYIVPYNINYKDNEDGKYKKKTVAQFQIGAKGLKQLALRTGQFMNLNCSDVREGEILNHDRLTGSIEFNWIQDESERLAKKIIGYVSYFKLNNGYSQTFYMTIEKINDHAKRYSKTFDSENGAWKTNYDEMCQKTITKLNLSKNAPLSIEMRKAITTDQSVVNNAETEDVDYVDAKEDIVSKTSALDVSNMPEINIENNNGELFKND